MELIEGVNAKFCTYCNKLEPFENFYKKKDGKYGLRSKCKKYNKEYSKEYNKENKEKKKEYHKEYYKENKEKINKKNKEYRKENKENINKKKKEYNKEYYKENKEKIKEYHKEYYKENKEKINKKNKEYRKENKENINKKKKKYYKENKEKYREKDRKRRALKNNAIGNFTEKQFRDTLKFFDWKCAYSGEPILRDLSNCHREHIIPLSKGGDNGIWNIVPSLDSVNLNKHDSDMEKWYRQQPYFSEERLNKIYEYVDLMKEIYLEDMVS